MTRRTATSALAAALGTLLALATAAAGAGGGSPLRLTAPYGTADLSMTTLHSSAFLPNETASGYTPVGLWNYRSALAADAQFSAPLVLPHGVQVELVSFYLCDDSTDAGMILGLQRCSNAEGGCSFTSIVSTSGVAAPGCVIRESFTPFAIDNDLYNYRLLITDNDGSNLTRFKAVRLAWRRQLSDPPAGQTFDDIPVGHDLHAYVELLAAAGITAGCGGGDFCADHPVTRGQLALWLARALGLHFPN